MPFQQRTNTSWRSIRSQPAVSRRLFRCLGAHLLRSPWNVNSGLTQLARSYATAGHDPPVENLGSPAPFLDLCQLTSSRCRFGFSHRLLTFCYYVSFTAFLSPKTKNPAHISVSRVWKNSMVLLLPAYLRVIQIRFEGLPFIRPG